LPERLRALADGVRKAKEAKRMIDRVRTFSGYREYPKHGIVNRYFVHKQALLEEAERLVQADVLRDRKTSSTSPSTSSTRSRAPAEWTSS
jgi:pyruvate,water dikinase